MNKSVVVVDLDGTLCDCAHRVQHAMNREWDKFHSLIPQDKMFKDVAFTIDMLSTCVDISLVALTGRNESYLNHTIDWLRDKKIMHFDAIIMRPNNNYEQDHVLKPKLLEQYFGSRDEMIERVLFVLEDRDKVVEAWRNLGINCWQVRQGTY